MAQRTEKEETEFKVPDATTAPPSSTASAQIPTILKFSSGDMTPRSRLPRRSDSTVGSRTLKAHQDRPTPMKGASESESTLATSRREVNRCSGCRRKVGLTGFRCRCGDLFCSEHRYSDRHVCSYDYKAAGREMIARENPVVKAAKIIKV